MDVSIRECRPPDSDAAVALSLRAWAPVFGWEYTLMPVARYVKAL
jgi:hypothetical protein